MNRIYTGTVEGTGSEIEITLGFIPNYVRLFNIDGVAILEWTPDMGAGKGLKIADSGTGATDIELISSGGVTISSSSDDFRGFKIGTDSDINVEDETINYVAFADRE